MLLANCEIANQHNHAKEEHPGIVANEAALPGAQRRREPAEQLRQAIHQNPVDALLIEHAAQERADLAIGPDNKALVKPVEAPADLGTAPDVAEIVVQWVVLAGFDTALEGHRVQVPTNVHRP